MRTSLLVLNEGGGGGRSEKFETRERLLVEENWKQLTHTFPTTLSLGLVMAFMAAFRTIIREDVDVIHSVSNPFHLHLIALVLRVVSRRPWIAEFRDPLVTNPDVEEDSWRACARRMIETIVVRTADRVAWFDMIQLPENYFKETYPSVPIERWVKLPPVGFEQALFEDVQGVEFDEFTITYAGSFYQGWIEPYSFLAGVEQYVSQYGEDIKARFYGDWNNEYQAYVESRELEDVVTYEGHLPHDEIVPVLKGSDLLLYIGGSNHRNRRSISSKMWDYIGARSPILAIAADEFRVHDFIKDYQIGISVISENTGAIADVIQAVKTKDFDYTPKEDVFTDYTRSQNVQVLAEAMNELVD